MGEQQGIADAGKLVELAAQHAFVAENVIEGEAHNLLDIAMEYAAAVKSGKFGTRNIKPEQARVYAAEFRARSDALFLIAPTVSKAIRARARAASPEPATEGEGA